MEGLRDDLISRQNELYVAEQYVECGKTFTGLLSKYKGDSTTRDWEKIEEELNKQKTEADDKLTGAEEDQTNAKDAYDTAVSDLNDTLIPAYNEADDNNRDRETSGLSASDASSALKTAKSDYAAGLKKVTSTYNDLLKAEKTVSDLKGESECL